MFEHGTGTEYAKDPKGQPCFAGHSSLDSSIAVPTSGNKKDRLELYRKQKINQKGWKRSSTGRLKVVPRFPNLLWGLKKITAIWRLTQINVNLVAKSLNRSAKWQDRFPGLLQLGKGTYGHALNISSTDLLSDHFLITHEHHFGRNVENLAQISKIEFRWSFELGLEGLWS